MSIKVISAGGLTTVQDMGRRGYANRGVQENGACDKFSYQAANLLAGNLPGKGFRYPAALEMTLRGVELLFTSCEVIALAGADMMPRINGQEIPMYRPVIVEPGDVLVMGMAQVGLRGYLAVYGGFAVPEQMGSCSTSLKCRLGGLEGRPLKADDILESKAEPVTVKRKIRRITGRERILAEATRAFLLPASGTRTDGKRQYTVLRVVEGPQQEAFTPEGIRTFVQAVYELSPQSDRMACKLSSPAVETCHGSDIISDGIVEGSVQVASDGMPMVMMADHQTTGGYAKIGTVISADIPRLAQKKPGEAVAFQFVTPEEAILAARSAAGRLAELEKRLSALG